MPKLSVTIQNYKTFKDVDKSLFERFYFGYPYCLEKAGSFLVELNHLKQAIEEVKQLNKQAFLATPALMQTKDFELMEKTIDFAVQCGLDGIEINDVGMFQLAKKWPKLQILSGYFTNIYNPEVALEYIKEGATTVLAHPELMFEELKEISEAANVEVGVAVYGNLPLGVVYDCYLKTVDKDNKCQQQCSKPHYFDHEEFAMINVGKANVMAGDFCLLEHVEKLKQVKASYWRIESYFYKAEKINKIGQAFKDCINGADPDDYIDGLKELAPRGLCDGWFVGSSGHSYIGCQGLGVRG